VNTDLWLPNM
jgi:hypothetical protein